MKRTSLFWLCLLLTGNKLCAQTPLFTYGSSWSYLDNGTDQGAAWRSLTFNDSSWKTGNGKFGYGLSGLTTVVSYGPNSSLKYITTYFRKTISFTDPSVFTSFTAGVLRDDGVVVYVNGVEVYRNNLSTGSINYLTKASNADDNGKVTQSFIIDPSVFVSGNNIIAVEIHQKSATSSDLAFDLKLSGEGATLDLTPPVAVSIRRQSPATQMTSDSTLTFRITFSEKVRGVDRADLTLTTVSGIVSGVLSDNAVAPVGTDSVAYDVTVNAVQGDGTLRLDLNGSGTGITDTAGNVITTGFTNGETYIIDQGAPPAVVSVNRQLPASENTDTSMVTFRVIFSEKVRGVDAADFITFTLDGNVRGTLTKVAQAAASTSLPNPVKVVGSDSTTYDVTIRAIAGSGVLRLDVKGSNTGITDVGGNALNGGFTNGQRYSINTSRSRGFYSFLDIDPISISSHTKEMPQAKVWTYAGKWWAVLATSGGTKVLRLDSTSWTDVLTIATATNARADCRVVGNLVHVLLFRGASSKSHFVSLEYDNALNSYKLWTQRTSTVNIVFESGTITATLANDTTGRIWIASNSSGGNMLVRWSDPPYSTWSSPITIASGVTSSDICAITALRGKIGVFWSNQNTKRFGFKTHNDSTDPTLWSADEVPASQSALSAGSGMADDHLNVVAASDGTLYCAVKTGYSKSGLPTIALLVRRPNSTWDNLYPVSSSKEGNRPIVVLNEAAGKVKVIYSSHLDNFNGTRSGDILYRESSTSAISFGAPVTLMSGNGNYNLEYTASSHQTYHPAILVLATNESVSPLKAVGVLATDSVPVEIIARSASSPALSTALPDHEMNEDSYNVKWLARPNPFTNNTTVDFSLPLPGRYSITLYDSKGSLIRVIRQGWAEAGIRNMVSIDGYHLANGLYLVKIQTDQKIKTLKLLKR